MKRQSIFLISILALAILVATTGCSAIRSGTVTDGSSSAVWSTDVDGERQLEGTLKDLKDSMFVLAGDDGSYFAFSYPSAEHPEGLDRVKTGDRVVVTYTGTLSQVAPFKGVVESVEKCGALDRILTLILGK